MNSRLIRLAGITVLALALIYSFSAAQTSSSDNSDELIQGRDDAKVDKLVSDLEQGQNVSESAAGVLAQSGQPWILPKLEKALFLKAEDEPKPSLPPYGGTDIVIYPLVSEDALKACVKIVERSPEFSPRLKSWISIIDEGAGWLPGHDEVLSVLQQWWTMNRAQLVAGQYGKLIVIPLWPAAESNNQSMDVPFYRPDYFSALQSKYTFVQQVALHKIMVSPWIPYLNDQELNDVNACLDAQDETVRAWAAHILSMRGEEGTSLLTADLSRKDPKSRGLVAANLLKISPASLTVRVNCIVTLIETGSIGDTQMMRLEMVPLLKRRLLDSSLSDQERSFAAYGIMAYSTRDDVPFWEAILKKSFPNGVRDWAVRAICNLYPQGEPPDCIRKLADDSEVGPLIKQNHYLEKPKPVTLSPPINSSDFFARQSDQFLIETFSGLINRDDIETGGAATLSQGGERGIALLRAALAFPNDDAKGSAAAALIELNGESSEERKQDLICLLDGLDAKNGSVSDYLLNHPKLKSEVMPLLKERIFDPKVSDANRVGAALLFATWATKKDLPFLDTMLSSKLPSCIRGMAVHGICRLYPQGEPPESIQKLADDPDVGPMIKIYRYLEKMD
jgi:hypothetical protein